MTALQEEAAAAAVYAVAIGTGSAGAVHRGLLAATAATATATATTGQRSSGRVLREARRRGATVALAVVAVVAAHVVDLGMDAAGGPRRGALHFGGGVPGFKVFAAGFGRPNRMRDELQDARVVWVCSR